MRPTLLTLLALVLIVPAATASDPVSFARTPDISPDGQTIAFSYLGDIYTVEAIGGTARAITSHPGHDVGPVFSPDGSKIAFSSSRHGGYDVFVTSVRGGKPTRLTFDSATDMVSGWSPDGKYILFASTRTVSFPPAWELYKVPVEGGKIERVTTGDGKDGTWSPRGDMLAYTRGPGSWYRKNYRGSSNDDLWISKADGTANQRFTAFYGQDHSPMWNADGSVLYFVSEHHGSANIVCKPISSKPDDRPKQVTFHTDDAVRRARISRNGEWIVYECGFDLWIVSTKSEGRSRKVAIEVNADEKANNEVVRTFTNNVTEFNVNADDKFVVFAVHGKLFRIPVTSTGKPTQMTFGKSNDHGANWSPDSSKIVFVSDMKGQEDIYLLEADDPDHPKLTEAHKFKVTQLTDSKDSESGVTFSPDGKKITFLRGGKLWVMNADGKDQKVIINDVQVFDYEWAPDGRWIVFARRDGSFASELYMVPAGGPTEANPIRNITRYATFNAGVTWSRDGKRLAFLSDRRSSATLHILELEKEAAKSDRDTPRQLVSWTWGSRAPLTIDFDDIHERVKPVIRGYVDEAAISPDGNKIAMRASGDLWVSSASGSTLTRITTGNVNPHQIQWTKINNLGRAVDVVYFLDGNGQIRLCNVGTTGPGSTDRDGRPNPERLTTLSFKVRISSKTDDLYNEMFEQGWRYISENFYDDKFHGSNWDEVRRRYQPMLKHVGMKEDLYALMYLMLGELNASHLGVSGFVGAPEEETAELGLLWDESYKGKGLKIAEILKRGPADKKNIGLKVGDVVVSIEDQELNDKANLSKVLNGKVGEGVVLRVTDKPEDPKVKARRVELIGVGRYRTSELMYDRWVAKNAAEVSKLSGGKLGYIHIPSMDEAGLDRFVRSLYSDNFDKDGIVLDVRYNGGGYTHDQVLNYLGGREHAVFRNRDGGVGSVLRSSDRKWHKPLVLLINNRSYSDAEIFPNAFRTMELGKLVGEPTGGMVIGTMGVRLVDGSTFRLPRIGVWTKKNVNMEKEGVKPDILIEPHPDDLAKGIDLQLVKAVDVVKADVAAWKKKNGTENVTTPVEKPTPVVTPMPMTTPK